MWRHLVAVPSALWAPVGMVRADDGPWGPPCGHVCFCHRKSMGGSRGEGWQAAQSAVGMGCWHRACMCGTQATVPSHLVTSLLSGPGGCPMLVLAPPQKCLQPHPEWRMDAVAAGLVSLLLGSPQG